MLYVPAKASQPLIWASWYSDWLENQWTGRPAHVLASCHWGDLFTLQTVDQGVRDAQNNKCGRLGTCLYLPSAHRPRKMSEAVHTDKCPVSTWRKVRVRWELHTDTGRKQGVWNIIPTCMNNTEHQPVYLSGQFYPCKFGLFSHEGDPKVPTLCVMIDIIVEELKNRTHTVILLSLWGLWQTQCITQLLTLTIVSATKPFALT